MAGNAADQLFGYTLGLPSKSTDKQNTVRTVSSTGLALPMLRFPEPAQYLTQKMPNPLARKHSQWAERT